MIELALFTRLASLRGLCYEPNPFLQSTSFRSKDGDFKYKRT